MNIFTNEYTYFYYFNIFISHVVFYTSLVARHVNFIQHHLLLPVVLPSLATLIRIPNITQRTDRLIGFIIEHAFERNFAPTVRYFCFLSLFENFR